ncbi:MAG: hypothetical protein RLZZ60_790 [Bacteroidota bacterium]
MKLIYRVSLLCMIAVLVSCNTKRKIYYLQDLSVGQQTEINAYSDPIIKSGDQLSIQIHSPNTESLLVYNFTAPNQGGGGQVGTGYLVDANGNIALPKLGLIKAAGLNFIQLRDSITKRLTPFLKDPAVNIKFQNFKYTVLGEVTRPGMFTGTDNDITILQAIGNAGDLTINAHRHTVLLIRQTNNERLVWRIDLTKQGLLKEPFYRLQSGDVIYVEPNKTRMNNSSVFLQLWPTVSSTITLLIVLINNFNK